MSTALEWMGAKDTAVTFLLPGQEAADGHEVVEDDVMVLQMTMDDGVAIAGEPGAIRSLAMRMIRATVLAEVKISENKKKAAKK